MKLNVILDQRFLHTADGATYDNGHATYHHWQRYLSEFGSVQVVGRSQLVAQVPPGYVRVDGPGVQVLAIAPYAGPLGMARRLPQVLAAFRRGVAPQDAVIVRLSGLLGHLCAEWRLAQGLPFAAEVINDPHAGYGPDGTRHPLRPLFRWGLTALTRRHLRRAAAALYVTQRALQARYPAAAPQFAVSDVHLPPEAFAAAPRQYSGPAVQAVLVGSLEQRHKAVDIALEALALLHAQGQPLKLRVVGDGPLRPALEAQAAALGLEQHTEFVGQRSTPAAVRRDLTGADLLLVPSRTEGLPRALLEGMAIGLPAIGSAVGGIPELLGADALVRPGDADDLARAWGELARDPARLTRQSEHHLAQARAYADATLNDRRRTFMQAVRQASQSHHTPERTETGHP